MTGVLRKRVKWAREIDMHRWETIWRHSGRRSCEGEGQDWGCHSSSQGMPRLLLKPWDARREARDGFSPHSPGKGPTLPVLSFGFPALELWGDPFLLFQLPGLVVVFPAAWGRQRSPLHHPHRWLLLPPRVLVSVNGSPISLLAQARNLTSWPPKLGWLEPGTPYHRLLKEMPSSTGNSRDYPEDMQNWN